MSYNLIIENYGKIEKAKLKISPLTLLVGDNNSGKSYLLSLIWALRTVKQNSILLNGIMALEAPAFQKLFGKLKAWIGEVTADGSGEIIFSINEFADVINLLLERNKNAFVSSIFNYSNISVGKLQMEFEKDYNVRLEGQYDKNEENNEAKIDIQCEGITTQFRLIIRGEITEQYLTESVLKSTIAIIIRDGYFAGGVVYLPAARTGFILAKDIINQVSRQKTYDWVPGEENAVSEPLQPFTKPIVHFLNVMDDLSVDNAQDHARLGLARWIEEQMAHGRVEYSSAGTREIRYLPEGVAEGIPLRASSAVVTELTPLMMILKYKKSLSMLCYEEPEMCLHPRLQLEMTRVLIRMVNQGIPVMATTHSDIILQHINNMIRAYRRKNSETFLREADIETADCIALSQVSVYQLKDCGETSQVVKLEAGENGFSIPTFTEPLMKMLEKSTYIHDFDED